MRFAEFTQLGDGSKVALNPFHMVAVEECQGETFNGTRIWYGRECYWTVREDYATVCRTIYLARMSDEDSAAELAFMRMQQAP